MGAISSGHIKWLWFTLSLLIFGPLVYIMLSVFKKMVMRSHPSISELYNKVNIRLAFAHVQQQGEYTFSICACSCYLFGECDDDGVLSLFIRSCSACRRVYAYVHATNLCAPTCE